MAEAAAAVGGGEKSSSSKEPGKDIDSTFSKFITEVSEYVTQQLRFSLAARISWLEPPS